MLAEGHEVTVMDNMDNASPEALKRVQKLSGKEVTFYEVSLLDVPGMEAIFAATKCVPACLARGRCGVCLTGRCAPAGMTRSSTLRA